jgi:hypothetical protein
MSHDDDWRLEGWDEQDVSGLTVVRRRFRARFPNDHEHCEFCWAKFMDENDPPHPEDTHVIFHEGYEIVPEWGATQGVRSWICDQCFRDFHERFAWKLIEQP